MGQGAVLSGRSLTWQRRSSNSKIRSLASYILSNSAELLCRRGFAAPQQFRDMTGGFAGLGDRLV